MCPVPLDSASWPWLPLPTVVWCWLKIIRKLQCYFSRFWRWTSTLLPGAISLACLLVRFLGSHRRDFKSFWKTSCLQRALQGVIISGWCKAEDGALFSDYCILIQAKFLSVTGDGMYPINVMVVAFWGEKKKKSCIFPNCYSPTCTSNSEIKAVQLILQGLLTLHPNCLIKLSWSR